MNDGSVGKYEQDPLGLRIIIGYGTPSRKIDDDDDFGRERCRMTTKNQPSSHHHLVVVDYGRRCFHSSDNEQR
eukprot:scaffold41448_cov199-Amphora_coffeaeformis.AAC.4